MAELKLDQKRIKRLLETEDGQYLKRYIAESIKALNSITGIESKESEEIALEVRSKIHAQDVLMDIFSQIVTAEEIKLGTKPPVNEYSMNLEDEK